MIRRYLQITLFCLALSGIAAASEKSLVVIEVNPDAVVKGEFVLLGEIAKISGSNEIVEKLNSASLGYSPDVGGIRSISGPFDQTRDCGKRNTV